MANKKNDPKAILDNGEIVSNLNKRAGTFQRMKQQTGAFARAVPGTAKDTFNYINGPEAPEMVQSAKQAALLALLGGPVGSYLGQKGFQHGKNLFGTIKGSLQSRMASAGDGGEEYYMGDTGDFTSSDLRPSKRSSKSKDKASVISVKNLPKDQEIVISRTSSNRSSSRKSYVKDERGKSASPYSRVGVDRGSSSSSKDYSSNSNRSVSDRVLDSSNSNKLSKKDLMFITQLSKSIVSKSERTEKKSLSSKMYGLMGSLTGGIRGVISYSLPNINLLHSHLYYQQLPKVKKVGVLNSINMTLGMIYASQRGNASETNRLIYSLIRVNKEGMGVTGRVKPPHDYSQTYGEAIGKRVNKYSKQALAYPFQGLLRAIGFGDTHHLQGGRGGFGGGGGYGGVRGGGGRGGQQYRQMGFGEFISSTGAPKFIKRTAQLGGMAALAPYILPHLGTILGVAGKTAGAGAMLGAHGLGSLAAMSVGGIPLGVLAGAYGLFGTKTGRKGLAWAGGKLGQTAIGQRVSGWMSGAAQSGIGQSISRGVRKLNVVRYKIKKGLRVPVGGSQGRNNYNGGGGLPDLSLIESLLGEIRDCVCEGRGGGGGGGNCPGCPPGTSGVSRRSSILPAKPIAIQGVKNNRIFARRSDSYPITVDSSPKDKKNVLNRILVALQDQYKLTKKQGGTGGKSSSPFGLLLGGLSGLAGLFTEGIKKVIDIGGDVLGGLGWTGGATAGAAGVAGAKGIWGKLRGKKGLEEGAEGASKLGRTVAKEGEEFLGHGGGKTILKSGEKALSKGGKWGKIAAVTVGGLGAGYGAYKYMNSGKSGEAAGDIDKTEMSKNIAEMNDNIGKIAAGGGFTDKLKGYYNQGKNYLNDKMPGIKSQAENYYNQGKEKASQGLDKTKEYYNQAKSKIPRYLGDDPSKRNNENSTVEDDGLGGWGSTIEHGGEALQAGMGGYYTHKGIQGAKLAKQLKGAKGTKVLGKILIKNREKLVVMSAGKLLLKDGTKIGLKNIPFVGAPIAAAFGIYGAKDSLAEGDKVGAALNAFGGAAPLAGIGIGAGIGSLAGGVGAVPGAAIGGLIGEGVSGVTDLALAGRDFIGHDRADKMTKMAMMGAVPGGALGMKAMQMGINNAKWTGKKLWHGAKAVGRGIGWGAGKLWHGATDSLGDAMATPFTQLGNEASSAKSSMSDWWTGKKHSVDTSGTSPVQTNPQYIKDRSKPYKNDDWGDIKKKFGSYMPSMAGGGLLGMLGFKKPGQATEVNQASMLPDVSGLFGGLGASALGLYHKGSDSVKENYEKGKAKFNDKIRDGGDYKKAIINISKDTKHIKKMFSSDTYETEEAGWFKKAFQMALHAGTFGMDGPMKMGLNNAKWAAGKAWGATKAVGRGIGSIASAGLSAGRTAAEAIMNPGKAAYNVAKWGAGKAWGATKAVGRGVGAVGSAAISPLTWIGNKIGDSMAANGMDPIGNAYKGVSDWWHGKKPSVDTSGTSRVQTNPQYIKERKDPKANNDWEDIKKKFFAPPKPISIKFGGGKGSESTPPPGVNPKAYQRYMSKKNSPSPSSSGQSSSGGNSSGSIPSNVSETKGSLDLNYIQNYIKGNEGLSLKPYKDANGQSIGFGHFIKPGENLTEITSDQANSMFNQDFQKYYADAQTNPEFGKHGPARDAVFIDLAYNMGGAWYKKFPGVMKALVNKDYKGAADALRDSAYAKQVGPRAEMAARALETGDITALKIKPVQGLNGTPTPSPSSGSPSPTTPTSVPESSPGTSTSSGNTPSMPSAPSGAYPPPPPGVNPDAYKRYMDKKTGANNTAPKSVSESPSSGTSPSSTGTAPLGADVKVPTPSSDEKSVGEKGMIAGVAEGTLTSPYGMRTHPIEGGKKFHPGIDIAGPVGTPIHAWADGTVNAAVASKTAGNMVILEHPGAGPGGKTLYTRYLHNSAFAVKTGDQVKKGQVIAQMGSTGNSTGPHSHFELRENPGFGQEGALDPMGTSPKEDGAGAPSSGVPNTQMAANSTGSTPGTPGSVPEGAPGAPSSGIAPTPIDPAAPKTDGLTDKYVREQTANSDITNAAINRGIQGVGENVGKAVGGIAQPMNNAAASMNNISLALNSSSNSNSSTSGGGGKSKGLQGFLEDNHSIISVLMGVNA